MQLRAGVAQLVEQALCKRQVARSSRGRWLHLLVLSLLLLAGPARAQSGLGVPLGSRGGQLPYLTHPQAWPSVQSLPAQSLTDGATIGVPPGSGAYFLTLAGSGHTISCPSGALANVRWLTFDITQAAGGPYTVIWDTCYGFPSFTPPTLTRDTGGVDSVSCYSVPTNYGTLRCGSMGAVGYGFLVRNNHAVGTLCSSFQATCTVTLANSVAGDLRVVGLYWGGGAGGNPLALDIVSMQDEHGNTCTEATSAFGTIPAGTRATDIWYCQVFAGASSSTVTITWGANVPNFTRALAVEVAGAAVSGVDAGLGNHNSGTGTALSVASNGSMPQPDNFVFAFFKSEGSVGGAFTAGANTTILDQADSGAPEGSTYQIPPASGSVATNAVTSAGSQGWSGSIAVFKHK